MAHGLKFRAAWWRKLKQLGYDVIPIRGKDAPCKGWPKMPNDEAAIEDWNGAGAAVRMRGSELLVIDLDVHVAAARDRMLDWMNEHHPEFMTTCLRRHSGAISIALIGRTVTAKGTQKTARYVGEGTDPKGDFIEVFTGNSKRYVGVAGAHSAQREYDYCGRHIIETPVDALPWLADSALPPMLAACEEIMVACGWEKVVPAIGKDAIGTKVYDLKSEMIFKLSDGTEVTLAELEDMAKRGMTLGDDHDNPSGDNRLRGYASLWDPSTGSGDHSSTRVLVTYGREGLCLFDTKYEVRHRWKHREPPKDYTEFATLLQELVKEAWS
jgi:bifunctional DNA primase/polymerase-like protein